jgi:hypothetical protein
MPRLHTYTFTESDLTGLANQVKEVVITGLVQEGFIDGDPEEIAATYAVVTFRDNILGRFWNKLRGLKEKEEARMCFVKAVDPLEVKKDDEPGNN